ncbi:hypothetical protein AMECASPLE_012983 [Ameca splendens]|uniref:Uncharacterized protein n=1 Tax=Ameca splendens TaxID=208324 RepID=A0ABV0YD14_9TELE
MTGAIFHIFTWLVANCKQHLTWLFFNYHSSTKVRYVECISNSFVVNRLSHLSCGSLELLQSYHGSLGCFSE